MKVKLHKWTNASTSDNYIGIHVKDKIGDKEVSTNKILKSAVP